MPDLAAHEGFPGPRLALQGHDAVPRADLAGALAHPRRRRGFLLDVAGLDGRRGLGACIPRRCPPSRSRRRRTASTRPEEHLYQLRGQLYRDLRVRIDTGHPHRPAVVRGRGHAVLGRSSTSCPAPARTPQALKLDAKSASCKAARAAVTRYSRWPTQAITYRLGKEQILALRKRAQQSARRALLGAALPPRVHEAGHDPGRLLRRGAAARAARRAVRRRPQAVNGWQMNRCAGSTFRGSNLRPT